MRGEGPDRLRLSKCVAVAFWRNRDTLPLWGKRCATPGWATNATGAGTTRTFVLSRWASPVPVVVEEPESDTLLQATPEQGFGGLAECIGKRFELGGAAVVPLPHPSGASSWLNSPANREHVAVAAKRIREELAAL